MAVLTLLALLGGAPRLQVAPEVEVAAGYDDNLFLNPDLAGAASTAVADAILHVEPRVLLSLRKTGHQLSFLYDGMVHEPLSGSYGTIADQLAILEYRTPEINLPEAPVILRASAIGERYDATFTSDGTAPDQNFDAFWLGGGEGGFDFVGQLARIGAAYRYSVRDYIHRVQQDTEQRLTLYYDARPVPRLAAGVLYAYTHIASETAGEPNFLDGLGRHRLSLPLRFGANDFSLRGEPSLTLQTLPRFLNDALEPVERHDIIFGVSFAGQIRVNDALDLFARYELLRASSDDASGRFTRNQLLFGVIGRTSVVAGGSGLPPPVIDEQSLAPRILDGGKVRFRLRAAHAREVVLVGDFTSWAPVQMLFLGDDIWETNVSVPVGRHTYSFLVDGQNVRPVDAESYVSDGFGGENGVFTVGD